MTLNSLPPTPAPLDAHGFYHPNEFVIQDTPLGEFYNVFFRGLTHKLNNFLAVIQGFSSLILMNDGLDPGIRENLDHMKEATYGAGVLGERILSCSGNVRLTPQAMNLQEYLPLIESNLRGLFSKHGIPLQLNIAPNTPAVLVDNGRFKELLVEIANNAAEAVLASGQPGAAAVDVIPPGHAPGSRPNHVDIFIRNTGPAIAPEKLRDLFVPFKSTKDSKHFGIGLNIAHMLAGQMGIQIAVKSDQESTTLWLSVPVAS
jgi:signal transduction histidine kinase